MASSSKDALSRPKARGRTPEARLRRQAQALGGVALCTLQKVMLDEAAAANLRLAAAREILDRGLGRPKLGPVEGADQGLTVVIKRFTDAPDPEAGEYEEQT